jgi:hypothetical protein
MASMAISRTGLRRSGGLSETPEPTDEELRILREEVDPAGFVIGRVRGQGTGGSAEKST